MHRAVRALALAALVLAGTGCAVGEQPSASPTCGRLRPSAGIQQAEVSASSGGVASGWRDASATIVQICASSQRLPDDLPALRDPGSPGTKIEAVALSVAGQQGAATRLRLVYPPTSAEHLTLRGPLAQADLRFPPLATSSCRAGQRPLVHCSRTGWLQTLRWTTDIAVAGRSTSSLMAEMSGVPAGRSAGPVPGAFVMGTHVVDGRLVLDVGVFRDRLKSPTEIRLRLSAVYDWERKRRPIEGRLPVLSDAIEIGPLASSTEVAAQSG